MRAGVIGRRRVWLAIAASLSVHALAAAMVVGSSLSSGWRANPVDIEITGMRLEDLADLPLGPLAPPPASDQRADQVVAPPTPPRTHIRQPAKDRHDETAPKPDRTQSPRPAAADADHEAAPPRPASVRSYGPQGSRVTALMRIDRLRGTVYAPAVDALMLHLPDRRDLLEGTGVDLYRDIDAILIATPNPRDARVTFLAVRHRLSDAELRAALEHGAHATGGRLTWRSERGRPFAERRPAPGVTAPPGRDTRLILLAAPHLVVVTPPAYRSLILRGRADLSGVVPRGRDGGARDFDAGTGTADRDAATGDGGPDGAPRSTGVDDGRGWTALLRRIDAEDSVLPADAVAMVSVVDLFSARDLRAPVAAAPATRGAVDDQPSVAAPGATVLGLPVPRVLTATLGVTPNPFADVDGEFADEAEASRWQDEWPALRHKLLANPLVVLTGFSRLIGRATLARTGAAIRVHVDATESETTRILELVAAQLAALGH